MTLRPTVIHEDLCALEAWDEPDRARVRWRTLLSADRTPTGSLTLGIAELPPGPGARRLHRHPQVEAYYVVAGEGLVVVDGEEHPVRPGSAVFIPGDVEHGAINTGETTLRLLYVFPVDAFEEVEYRFS